MASITRFEEIQAWQQARKLVCAIYELAANGPLKNDFGLRNQLCRAAVSSMSNVAEGFSRKSDKDFAHFLDIARGSAAEVQSLLYVALDIGYIAPGEFQCMYRATEETAALIGGFTSYLRTKSRAPSPQDPAARHRTPNSGLRTQTERL